MHVLLYHLDGALPNLALMRIAAHYRRRGAELTLRRPGSGSVIQRELGEPVFDAVYASCIFEQSRALGEAVRRAYPGAVIGGTGWSLSATIEELGIGDREFDYSLYSRFTASIGFTQRGCRRRCPFCVVPQKEGRLREVGTVSDVWRGEPHPRDVVLLDNDFFGQPSWRERVREIVDGGYRVSLCQGINARKVDEEIAQALASMDYRSTDFKSRWIYTAWDHRRDERAVMRGLTLLRDAGINPKAMIVYMLIGFDPKETHDDRDHRRRVLREFGCIPYPMVYRATRELRGFQRWVRGALDLRVSWDDFTAAGWRDDRFRQVDSPQLGLFEAQCAGKVHR